MNSFVKEYVAGSALYHWLLYDILYGKTNENIIEFKYIV